MISLKTSNERSVFYHLTQTPLEVALPKILERALSANWSIEIRANVNTNLEDMSNSIWKGSEESFLPNCLENHEDVQDYPIVLSNSPLKKLRDCLIVVDQAELQENDVESHKRVCLILMLKMRLNYLTPESLGRVFQKLV